MCSNFLFLLSEVVECSRSPAEAWGMGSLWRCMQMVCEVRPLPACSSMLVHSLSVAVGHQHAGQQPHKGEETPIVFIFCVRGCSCLMQSIEWLISIGTN